MQRILILTVQRYAESDETYSWLLNAYKYTLNSHEAIMLLFVFFFMPLVTRVETCRFIQQTKTLKTYSYVTINLRAQRGFQI